MSSSPSIQHDIVRDTCTTCLDPDCDDPKPRKRVEGSQFSQDASGNVRMDLNRAVLALNALAQETRLQIIRILVPAGSNGVAAGVIAETLGVAPPTLSFHLQQLIFSGLIEKRRASRSLIYSVNAQGMRQLVEFLTEDCCGGRPELCLPVRTETAKRVKVDTPKARKRAER